MKRPFVALAVVAAAGVFVLVRYAQTTRTEDPVIDRSSPAWQLRMNALSRARVFVSETPRVADQRALRVRAAAHLRDNAEVAATRRLPPAGSRRLVELAAPESRGRVPRRKVFWVTGFSGVLSPTSVPASTRQNVG
jgi:hypothetical protein